MRIVDLSIWMDDGAKVIGAPFPPPVTENIATLEEEGWIAHRFVFTSLHGTYLEASAHVFPDGEGLDQVPIERCIRPASVFHLKDIGPRHAISVQDLEAAQIVPKPGDAVLIATGWDQKLNQPDYLTESPFFQYDAMRWLIEHGASVVGADIGSYDDLQKPMEIIKLLFATNCLLLAPLMNLHLIADIRPLLVALPIKVKGVCGAPCRAIIIQN